MRLPVLLCGLHRLKLRFMLFVRCNNRRRGHTLLQEILDGKRKALSFNDNSLLVAIKARSRLDRILGLDPPPKATTDGWLDAFLDALNGPDEPDSAAVQRETQA